VSTTQLMDTTVSERRHYRSWPEALKREIVAASFEAGASVSLVARRYDVNANQVFRWRQMYRDGTTAAWAAGDLAMVPVTVTSSPSIPAAASAGGASPIEIELAGGYRIRVDAQVDATALRRVLDVLEQRAVCRSLGEGR
jgi:transposase